MGRKQQLRRMAEAVQGILGDPVKKKKLKKRKVLKRFLARMEARRDEIQAELDGGGLKKSRQEMLEAHLRVLDTQIKRARKIVKAMAS